MMDPFHQSIFQMKRGTHPLDVAIKYGIKVEMTRPGGLKTTYTPDGKVKVKIPSSWVKREQLTFGF